MGSALLYSFGLSKLTTPISPVKMQGHICDDLCEPCCFQLKLTGVFGFDVLSNFAVQHTVKGLFDITAEEEH